MKTADLIPLILLELNECDKYGFELTKNIETKSNGKIIIKQPTLYTLLKKLEKSKFITSYWQDSEIGGKRHYYKLTENGKLQVSTLPSYDILLNSALSDDAEEEISNPDTQKTTETQKKFEQSYDIHPKQVSPIETILPSHDVFADNALDTVTELEINTSNTDILKDNVVSRDEEFANNTSVIKFTEKIIESVPESSKNNDIKQTTSHSIIDTNFSIPKNEMSINYIDYVDLKNGDNYKYGKKVSKNLLLQSLYTCASLIGMLIICSIITYFTSRSGLYYLFFIASILIVIFYPLVIGVNMNKIRIKFQSSKYKKKTKARIYIGISLFLVILLLCVLVNMSTTNNTIALMFNFNNFENFYAPLLFTSVYFLDTLYNHILFKKRKK